MAVGSRILRHDVTDRWSAADSAELYDVARWGVGYFSVSDNGHLLVHPQRTATGIDLVQLVDKLELRGIKLPTLIRFNGILKNRMHEIRDAFERAREDHGYQGRFTCVYPIKVNQQRQVVQQIVKESSPLGFGIEAGSKPELLAVIAMSTNETPIVCNGFKDQEYIETALMAQRLGRRVVPVVERFSELSLIIEVAKRLNVRPTIGVRCKLATRGSGRWERSAGFRSKFGLSVSELLQAHDLLQSEGMGDCLHMLHFHLGSQITNIRHIKRALDEAARCYVALYKRGAAMQTIDVGGGLGVDYDGSQTDYESSVNYTLQEYANDVIYHIQLACDAEGVPHPEVITECGRALVAYHCVLVFEALGASGLGSVSIDSETASQETSLRTLKETLDELNIRNLREAFHDAQTALDMSLNLFASGHISLQQRSQAEQLFWAVCRKIQGLTRQLDDVPEELAGLDTLMASTYYCNFSVFQSMPDSWAIQQLFPIVPLHRLNEEPIEHAVLADITCDSDGKIDQFIHRRDIRRTLRLHPLGQDRYMLAACLVGAYQEILGDLHNLFGDTHSVNVSMRDDGEANIESVVKGDTVSQVLGYVEFDRGTLLERLQAAVETAVQEGRISHQEAGEYVRFYEEGLNGYTYLEDFDASQR